MNPYAISHYFGTGNAPVIQSAFDLIDLSRQGLTKKAIATMAENLRIMQDDLLIILNISVRTWQRYQNDKPMSKEVTERALQLAQLYQRGEEVFGEPWKFHGWMNHPSYALGGKKPIELLDTLFGFQYVTDEIIRIEHGVLA